MKEAIRFAPSSYNIQPWKIKIISDKETLLKLQEVSVNQAQIGTASHLFVFCAYENLNENKDKLLVNMKRKIPEEKLNLFKKMLEGFMQRFTKDEQSRLSERELFMPVENLMLSATDLGYGSCPVGGFEADKYKEILNISDNLKPIVVVPVGIPVDTPREKFRFDEEDIFF